MVTRTKKIFVGGLSAPSTLEDVKNYFEQFGRVSLAIFLIKITSNSVWTTSYTYTKTYPRYFSSRLRMRCWCSTNKPTDTGTAVVDTTSSFFLGIQNPCVGIHHDVIFITKWYKISWCFVHVYLCLCLCLSFAGVSASSRLRARTWWIKFARYTSMKSTIKWSVPSE